MQLNLADTYVRGYHEILVTPVFHEGSESAKRFTQKLICYLVHPAVPKYEIIEFSYGTESSQYPEQSNIGLQFTGVSKSLSRISDEVEQKLLLDGISVEDIADIIPHPRISN